MRKQHAGLPANIWTLLETMDAELKEPEWVQPSLAAAAMTACAAAETVTYAGGRKSKQRARETRAAAEAELGDLDLA